MVLNYLLWTMKANTLVISLTYPLSHRECSYTKRENSFWANTKIHCQLYFIITDWPIQKCWYKPENAHLKRKGWYNCTADLLFDLFGIGWTRKCFTLCCNQFQTGQTGSSWYSNTSLLKTREMFLLSNVTRNNPCSKWRNESKQCRLLNISCHISKPNWPKTFSL